MTTTEYLYIPADMVRVGDTLPTVSRHPVTGVTVHPSGYIKLVFGGGVFLRHVPFGGLEYGYECFRVERSMGSSRFTPAESRGDSWDTHGRTL